MRQELKPAFNFLKILQNSKETCVIVCGHDCDSICSAAIIKKLFDKLNINSDLHVSKSNYTITKSDLKKLLKYRYIIFLDLGDIKEEFVELLVRNRCEVLIIDHHVPKNYRQVFYVNPRLQDPDAYVPVSCICWKLYSRFFDEKETVWIGAIGTLADFGVESNKDLFKKLRKYYPKLLKGKKLSSRFLITNSLLGKLVQLIDAMRIVKGIKGVYCAIKILSQTDDYTEILRDEKIRKCKEILDKEVKRILKKLRKEKLFIGKRIVFFVFSSKFNLKSMIASISTKYYPARIIIIGQMFGKKIEFSLRRGDRLKSKVNLTAIIGALKKKLKNLEGGGHPSAAGMRISRKNLSELLSVVKEIARRIK